MPNCFQLKSIETGEPKNFIELDNEMCEHFGIEPNPERWLMNWYNFIGLALSVGKTFDEIRTYVHEDETPMLDIIDYIEQRYVPDAWYESK